MEKVKILGVVGSPRKNGNTFKLMEIALRAAAESSDNIETEMYELAGKKIHHCTGCLSCLNTGSCVFKDDLQGFVKKYMEADGVIWGAPLYHMAIPGLMKNVLDRFGNYNFCNYVVQNKEYPRFSKVCGVLTIGATRHGGQDLLMSYMGNSSLLMNGVMVAGDTILGNYIGAAAYTGGTSPDEMRSKEVALGDEENIVLVKNLAQRVAEMTRIVKCGLSTLRDELPSEYTYEWEEIE